MYLLLITLMILNTYYDAVIVDSNSDIWFFSFTLKLINSFIY